MDYLLDTHALIWWWDQHERLSAPARGAITDPRNRIFVSAATALELATLVRSNRLPTMAPRIHAFNACVSGDGFHHVAVSHDHARYAGLMEGTHRDPFDRLLAAQGVLEGLAVITRDPEFAAFGCKVLW